MLTHYPTLNARASFTTAHVGTQQTVVAAPGAKKRIVVDRIILSQSADITVFDGSLYDTAAIGPQFNILSNDWLNTGAETLDIRLPENTALKFNVVALTGAGTSIIWVKYHIEGIA